MGYFKFLCGVDMKLSGFILLAVAAVVINADPDPTGRKFSAIGQFIKLYSTTNKDYATFNKMVQNYGCHCFPELSRTAGGKGPAVDDKDELCRELSRCHSCVMMDNGGPCDADHNNAGKYKYKIDEINKTIDCSGNDPGSCKESLCLCDSAFAEKFGALWDDANFNTFYWMNKHNKKQNPTFDDASTCVASGGNNANDCCGDYPDRYPYSDTTFECCGDGTVKSIGSC